MLATFASAGRSDMLKLPDSLHLSPCLYTRPNVTEYQGPDSVLLSQIAARALPTRMDFTGLLFVSFSDCAIAPRFLMKLGQPSLAFPTGCHSYIRVGLACETIESAQ